MCSRNTRFKFSIYSCLPPSACYIAETQESNTLKCCCLNAVMLGLILPPRPQQNGGVVNQQGHHYCDFVPIFVEAAP